MGLLQWEAAATVKMGLMHPGLLLLLFCSAYSYQFQSRTGFDLGIKDPDEEWRRMQTMIDDNMNPVPSLRSKIPKATPPSFPMFVRVPKYKYPTEAFKPEKGGRELPKFAKDILLVPSSSDFSKFQPVPTETAVGKSARPKVVEMLCHIDRIYVRILNNVFTTVHAHKNLRLGKCGSNYQNVKHSYFLYPLKADCGFILESKPDFLLIKTVLQYNPPGSVVREIPFNIPLRCVYYRTFHSYKVGFHPKLQGGTVFKSLQPKQNAILVPIDESGNEITGTETYILGQQMYFMAKRATDTATSGNQRMYINKCFMTPSQNPNSNPKHVVIDNQGCLVDSKVVMQSKFISSSSKLVQKFTVAAFLFKDMVSSSSSSKQLYMHCEVSVGKVTPTPSSKACTYDAADKVWKELYNDDSVCSCCETSCPLAQPKASRKTISSPSWRVDLTKDGSVDVEFLNSDANSWEDPDIPEQSDFVNYWEQDD